MATDSRSLPAFFNTNADFESWCQGIAAQLVVAGMVKTADTGQINNVTVAKPGGTSTAMGYEIYRFSDAAQSTSPIYFKIEYGSGTTAAASPGIWLTAGTGSDGAGNITGTVFGRTQICGNLTYSAGVTLTSYCCGDGGRLAFASNSDNNNSSSMIWFVIDRIRDGTGAVSGDGWTALSSNIGDQRSVRINHLIGGIITGPLGPGNTLGASAQMFPSEENSSTGQGAVGKGPAWSFRVLGNNVFVWPLIVAAGQMRFLSIGILYNFLDFGSLNGETITATNLGTTHTYLTLPQQNSEPNQAVWGSGTNNMRLAILWE